MIPRGAAAPFPDRRGRVFLALPVLAVLFLSPSPARAQSLGDLVKKAKGARDSTGVAEVDSLAVPPAPWPVVAGEVAAGTALAAGLAYGVGLVAEHTVCGSCRASEPGGDTPGILIGIPVGAVAGVWLVGRRSPPGGDLADTALGAMAGAAVFAGYSQLLENQGNLVRWSGVVLSAAVTAIGWNQSRRGSPETASLRWGGLPGGGRRGGWEMPLLSLDF